MAAELLLFLLLPAAAYTGWRVGRRGGGTDARRADGLTAAYYQGLNYLLDEQPDKAIEVFVNMIEVDRDTVEMHLALGSLFRRRGEVDRAIRVHQNLIARPTLAKAQREQALHELGEDYMRAGLFDRAEALFTELARSTKYRDRALRQLSCIYQQEKDWHQAIDATSRLEQLTGQRELRAEIAHFYCELAEQARQENEPKEALRLLRRALATDGSCVRATLLEAELALAEGNCKGAFGALRRVEQQDPHYLPEAVEPLMQCAQPPQSSKEVRQYLLGLLERQKSVSVLLAAAELVRETRGQEEAAALIAHHLRGRPSVRGIHRLIELHLQAEARDDLKMLRDVTTRLLAEKPVYRCQRCGFNGKALHWLCPGCKSWGTVKPIQGLEGE
ncbi:lipopolysaccharide assembly protein LapB [Ectothiorhodospiraceae bacterium 2226]|nr:lipopolysaccharide assembly protein LapB [Ectothiorhodospiraceae bacterium 2226]